MGLATLQVMTNTQPPKPVGGAANQVTAQFNPQTLQITYHTAGTGGSNTQENKVTKNGASGQSTGSLAELSFDLLFDTTQDGSDVRQITLKVVAMMRPDVVAKTPAITPPVQFHWGNFTFLGQIQSLSETIDFFSPIGVPLRSTVKITMTEQNMDRVDPAKLGAALSISASIGLSASVGVSAGVGFSAGASLSAGVSVGTTPLTLAQSGDTLQALAGRAGASASWQAIATANNIDNPRAIPAGTPLNLNISASASASIG